VHANHIGIYPYSGDVIATLKEELHAYSVTKGTIRVPPEKPIPKTH
jgi:uncharacterized protein YdhG (YjbR/CyaY superfamily)